MSIGSISLWEEVISVKVLSCIATVPKVKMIKYDSIKSTESHFNDITKSP